jgi:hypothetical protein
MRCLNLGSGLALKGNEMIDKTDMEAKAIRDARRPFAEVLTELGLMTAFFDRKPEEIDRLIEACVDGFQASITRQAREKTKTTPFNDEIPF